MNRECCAQRAPFEMAPIICGSNNWPWASKDATCTLPQVLQEGVTSFETFYNKKHSGRKLTFRSDMGTVDLKAKFKMRSHELNVSTHSMIVLALFEGLEDDEKLSYVVRFCLFSLVQPASSLTLAKSFAGYLKFDEHDR